MSDFAKIREANRARQPFWPGHEQANDIEFRCIEFSGESGEVADAIKKLLRFDRGIAGNRGQTREELITAIREEVGDALISLDMLADVVGIDMRDAFAEKFNKTSIKVGIPLMVDPGTLDTVVTSAA